MKHEKRNPGGGAGARRIDQNGNLGRPENRPVAGNEQGRKPRLKVRIAGDGDLFAAREMTLIGRQAWCLDQLHRAGQRGVTTVDRPAPRWSDYVFKLRAQGIAVATEHEAHGGTYPGHHARYKLGTEIDVVEREGLDA